MFHFMDEKHVIRSDAYLKKIRSDPLTGNKSYLPVSGNFRDAFNLMACISLRSNNGSHIFYSCGQQNGTAAAFQTFIEYMIGNRRFRHHDVLVLDNARIHGGAASDIFRDVLWNYLLDGTPLHVAVIFLPPRAPELNPIELIFAVLASRLRQTRYRIEGDEHVPRMVGRVLDDIPLDIVANCSRHCGYIV